ncbi:MAG TPA: 2,4'-dihydroxyacetophenone dioxygenase family protein [Usitatibacter sp.]|jgi:quercetin dioxygenase-like cupin family protein|nr:2,4'-dihydroxyacetophenone dioxygenase family protein [Usitatibacter sp.]
MPMTARKKASRAPAPRQAPAVAAPRTPVVHTAGLPWFPFLTEGVQLKLCKVNRSTGEMALLIRVAPGSGLGTHYFHGVVAAYTISGTLRSAPSEWVAGPGDVIVEPAGTSRAFEAVGDKPMEAFVHITGAIEFRDEAGRTLCIENAETLHGRYLAHCALHGITPVDVAA